MNVSISILGHEGKKVMRMRWTYKKLYEVDKKLRKSGSHSVEWWARGSWCRYKK